MVLAMMPCVVFADDGSRLAADSWDPPAPCTPAVPSISSDWNSHPLSSDRLQMFDPAVAGVDNLGQAGGPSLWEPPRSTDLDYPQDLRQLVPQPDVLGASADEDGSRSCGDVVFQDPPLRTEMPQRLDPWIRGVAYSASDDGPPAVEFASVKLPLDTALEDGGDAPLEGEIERALGPAKPIVPANAPDRTALGPRFRRETAARLGWWLVDLQGSPTMVAQYESVDSSPFWDVDWLSSDGTRTVDLTASGLDNESTQVSMSLFRPWLSMELDYQRFLHRLENQPLTNMGDITSSEAIVGEDLNVGEDYAVRIQDVRYQLTGRLTEQIKARVNFHLFRKSGERQSNTVQHCANPAGGDNRTCHVLSQRQRIDWLTTTVEPVVEADLGRLRAEYSRPMRFFSQDDQPLLANYGDFHMYGMDIEPYAVVPDGFSQADRLKLAADLGACTDFYASSFVRDTQNKLRDTHRKSYGVDMRLTNRSYEGVKLTAYATLNDQTNQFVPFLLPEEENALDVKTALIPPYGIRQPIDYFRRSVGADASWHPFRRYSALRPLTITGGVEQGRIERHFADYVVQIPEEPPGPVFDHDMTDFFAGNIGTSFRWSRSLDSFVRYRFRTTNDPLFAVERDTGYTSTSLPDQEDLVEIGGTWTPADNFLASVTFGQDVRSHQSKIATFDEDNDPITCTVWYAPQPAGP